LLARNPKLWADVFFPVIHGTHGEDGSLQGLFELADVAYVGSGILASAVGMDKVRTKRILDQAGIPTLDCMEVSRAEWESDPEAFVARAESRYGYPAMVKPVALGSSVGVSRCSDRPALTEALDLALELDVRALVEMALTDFIEINCSVMGPPERASACEQPIGYEAVLSFDDKYKRGAKKLGRGATQDAGMAGLARQVPAPIGEALTAEVKELAVKAFRAIDASGVVRIDFLYDRSKPALFLNEVNTTPGSLSYYLWEEESVRFDQLVSMLVEIALARHENRRITVYSFSANLLTK
jgi:D-alanine-D-alanine ligase